MFNNKYSLLGCLGFVAMGANWHAFLAIELPNTNVYYFAGIRRYVDVRTNRSDCCGPRLFSPLGDFLRLS